MVSKTLVINNSEGLHLRPATNLCNVAGRYKCKIHLLARGQKRNAKSVLNVLAAMVKQGDEVTFECDGEDETEAMDALVALVSRNMDMPN